MSNQRNHPMKPMNTNDLGNFLVEDCHRIELSKFLKSYRSKLKEMLITSELEFLGTTIKLNTSKTGYNGVRFWFLCPLCEQRVGVLLKHPLTNILGCRICLNLEYRKRRFKGMIESQNL